MSKKHVIEQPQQAPASSGWRRDKRVIVGMGLGFLVALALLGISWWRAFSASTPTTKAGLSDIFGEFRSGWDKSVEEVTSVKR